jgi:hypothetical protein
LTHVLLSDCVLSMGHVNIAEPVGVEGFNDQITIAEDVPASRRYPAGSLVFAGLAERLVDAGFRDAVIELARPVVVVAFEGDDPESDDPYTREETFGVEAYSLPVVEPSETEEP